MSGSTDLTKYIKKAVRQGAAEGKVVSPSRVFTADWVRIKCQYGCGGYGQCLTCPPYSPEPQTTRRLLDSYNRAILFHFVIPADKEDPDIRRMVVGLEQALFLDGYYRAFAMACGPCEVCADCDFDDCRNPDLARPAMEACGIDVFATARDAGYPIEVVKSTGDTQDRYALVLVD